MKWSIIVLQALLEPSSIPIDHFKQMMEDYYYQVLRAVLRNPALSSPSYGYPMADAIQKATTRHNTSVLYACHRSLDVWDRRVYS